MCISYQTSHTLEVLGNDADMDALNPYHILNIFYHILNIFYHFTKQLGPLLYGDT